ncbi:MAG TPA: hypothetical protein VGH19_22305 [Verrucomicrobiae bacterium]
MRIKYKRMVFLREPEEYDVELSAFLLQEDWFLAYEAGKRFPNLISLNKFLSLGRGNDGLIPSRWEPFQLTEIEYQELYREFNERDRLEREKDKGLGRNSGDISSP